MKIEISTYYKPGYDHEPYQKGTPMILSIEDGILFLGDSAIDDIVDAKELLAAIEALLKWEEKH